MGRRRSRRHLRLLRAAGHQRGRGRRVLRRVRRVPRRGEDRLRERAVRGRVRVRGRSERYRRPDHGRRQPRARRGGDGPVAANQARVGRDRRRSRRVDGRHGGRGRGHVRIQSRYQRGSCGLDVPRPAELVERRRAIGKEPLRPRAEGAVLQRDPGPLGGGVDQLRRPVAHQGREGRRRGDEGDPRPALQRGRRRRVEGERIRSRGFPGRHPDPEAVARQGERRQRRRAVALDHGHEGAARRSHVRAAVREGRPVEPVAGRRGRVTTATTRARSAPPPGDPGRGAALRCPARCALPCPRDSCS